MEDRFVPFLEKAIFFSKFQYGFVLTLLPKSPLWVLLHHYDRIWIRLFSAGLWLDFKRACEMVDHKILMFKLGKSGIPGPALDWFKKYSSDRTHVSTVCSYLTLLSSWWSNMCQSWCFSFLFPCRIYLLWYRYVITVVLFINTPLRAIAISRVLRQWKISKIKQKSYYYFHDGWFLTQNDSKRQDVR